MTTTPIHYRWRAAMVALAALAGGAASLFAAPPHACLDCSYTVDGLCRPKVETYGYYQTQWRTWPGPRAVSTTGGQRDPIGLPTQVEPPPTQEDLDDAPRPPLLPQDMGDLPPVDPATGNESPLDPRRTPGGEQLPMPPETEKPDPFRDDPVRNNGRGRETSILIPSLDAPIETYGLVDDVSAIPVAIRSSYDEIPRVARGVGTVSDAADLRLIGDASPTNEPFQPMKAANAAKPAADSGNPLRSGQGTGGAPSRRDSNRDPNIVTVSGRSTAANPLRR